MRIEVQQLLKVSLSLRRGHSSVIIDCTDMVGRWDLQLRADLADDEAAQVLQR